MSATPAPVPLDPELARVECLLEDLTKPIYVWRMARAQDGPSLYEPHDPATHRPRLSAHKRRVNALREVVELLEQWEEGE